MRYLACRHDDCPTGGAPFHTDAAADAELACPGCGNPLTETAEPEPTPAPTSEEISDVERERDNVRARIMALLDVSDHWAARAFEDGTTIAAPRRTYRRRLRKLLADVETAADPAALRIPDEPTFNGGEQ